MVLGIFIVAWLALLISVLAGGNPEKGTPWRWLLVAIILGCALYTMITVHVGAGLAMIGSLGVFMVGDKGSR